jgi:hypothetical protein
MERSRRRLPSPALVIACLALFVALGGTVLAATKINGRTIKVKSLPGNRLEVASLPGNRVVPGSLTGNQVDASTLAQVPDAAHATAADEARHAKTAVAADHATDATTINGRSVGCAEGEREFAGACWELTASVSAVSPQEAATTCAARGGELPSPLAFQVFSKQPGIEVGVLGEWTFEVSAPNEGGYGVVTLTHGGAFSTRLAGEPHQFRCVTPLIH